jgi:hypothetical protein
MTARPINYLLRRAPAPVLFFYRRELAVELVEELLVAEASRSLIRHGDDCLLVSRSPDPRLIRERNERKDRFRRVGAVVLWRSLNPRHPSEVSGKADRV